MEYAVYTAKATALRDTFKTIDNIPKEPFSTNMSIFTKEFLQIGSFDKKGVTTNIKCV